MLVWTSRADRREIDGRIGFHEPHFPFRSIRSACGLRKIAEARHRGKATRSTVSSPRCVIGEARPRGFSPGTERKSLAQRDDGRVRQESGCGDGQTAPCTPRRLEQPSIHRNPAETRLSIYYAREHDKQLRGHLIPGRCFPYRRRQQSTQRTPVRGVQPMPPSRQRLARACPPRWDLLY